MPGQTAIQQRRDNASQARGESEEQLIVLLTRISIHLQQLLDHTFRPIGLTAQEAALLIKCTQDKEISSGELAKLMGRDKGCVTRHLDRLEAHGLIRRSASPRDRRVILVRATRQGRRLTPRCTGLFHKVRSHLMESFFDVELLQVTGALSQILRKLGELP